jgi:hypothetical protein
LVEKELKSFEIIQFVGKIQLLKQAEGEIEIAEEIE